MTCKVTEGSLCPHALFLQARSQIQMDILAMYIDGVLSSAIYSIMAAYKVVCSVNAIGFMNSILTHNFIVNLKV